jgi:hypothetical protein
MGSSGGMGGATGPAGPAGPGATPVVAHVAVAGATTWHTLELPSGCTIAYVKPSEGYVWIQGIKLATTPVDGQSLKLGHNWTVAELAAKTAYTVPPAETAFLVSADMSEAHRKELEPAGMPAGLNPEAGTGIITLGAYYVELSHAGFCNFVWRSDLQRWFLASLTGER